MFRKYLDRWALTPDGAPVLTRTSHLLPVRRLGVAAMLKIATVAEEERGGALMDWWEGKGAVRVLAHEDNAILLERAEGRGNLADLVQNGNDDQASQIICTVISQLHEPRAKLLPDLIPLSRWFRDLEPAALVQGGVLGISATTARELLMSPCDVCVLHGDIHHGNILDFGDRGWLAIDPKGLIGERGFDYANLFCNPDDQTAKMPGRFIRQIGVVADAAGIERKRLMQWVQAWAGLSAVWHLADNTPHETAIAVAEIAAAELRA